MWKQRAANRTAIRQGAWRPGRWEKNGYGQAEEDTDIIKSGRMSAEKRYYGKGRYHWRRKLGNCPGSFIAEERARDYGLVGIGNGNRNAAGKP